MTRLKPLFFLLSLIFFFLAVFFSLNYLTSTQAQNPIFVNETNLDLSFNQKKAENFIITPINQTLAITITSNILDRDDLVGKIMHNNLVVAGYSLSELNTIVLFIDPSVMTPQQAVQTLNFKLIEALTIKTGDFDQNTNIIYASTLAEEFVANDPKKLPITIR